MSSRYVRIRPRTDGEPTRNVSCINVRRDEKAAFDVLHAWLQLREGRSLAQWDVFSLVFAAAVRSGEFEVPPGLRP